MAASPADEPAPWEPVITRPDPMTAEEREILLEHDLAEDLDPGELAWEDDFLNPDADLTEAELAEIAAAMQERAADSPEAAAGADPAGIAAVLAAQAAAASAHRRGPAPRRRSGPDSCLTSCRPARTWPCSRTAPPSATPMPTRRMTS